MNLELHNVKEGKQSQLSRDPKQHLNMQKDKVGCNIYTHFNTFFKGSLPPKTAVIDR